MIDWALFLLMLGALALIAWASYREGVNEGWRQAGRWADDYLPAAEDRPASRIDEDVAMGRRQPPYDLL